MTASDIALLDEGFAEEDGGCVVDTDELVLAAVKEGAAALVDVLKDIIPQIS